MSDVLEKKLGVTFEDSVLEYYSMPRPVQTHSQSRKSCCAYISFICFSICIALPYVFVTEATSSNTLLLPMFICLSDYLCVV